MMDRVRIQLLLFLLLLFLNTLISFLYPFPLVGSNVGIFYAKALSRFFFLSNIEDFFFLTEFFIARMNEHTYIL